MNLKHVGVDAFLAQRKELLDKFDKAKSQTADDAIKIEHGNVAEAVFRSWLEHFLPKRFGITKGYIITRNLEYEGPLEEWDIIIYDALEAPVLFIRETADNSPVGQKRAIPVEHVRAVIEVKATLNPSMALKATSKILKLKQFIGFNESPEYPMFLCQPFVCSTVFFETSVKTLDEYRKSLNELSKIYESFPLLPYMGGLIIRSQREQSHSGYLQLMVSNEPVMFQDVFEMSTPFLLPNGQNGIIGCMSFGVNYFSSYIFDLLASIKGVRTNKVSSFYGLDFENTKATRLFH